MSNIHRIYKKHAPNHGTGCDEWTAAKDGKGFGVLWVGGKLLKAHRLVFEHHHGPIAPGMQVLQECGNPRCIRITHLYSSPIKGSMRAKRDAVAVSRVLELEKIGIGLAGLVYMTGQSRYFVYDTLRDAGRMTPEEHASWTASGRVQDSRVKEFKAEIARERREGLRCDECDAAPRCARCRRNEKP